MAKRKITLTDDQKRRQWAKSKTDSKAQRRAAATARRKGTE
jgi:hypothetical protein